MPEEISEKYTVDKNSIKRRARRSLQLLLTDYVHWYNYKRIHGSIGYLPPIEYRRKYDEQYLTAEPIDITPSYGHDF